MGRRLLREDAALSISYTSSISSQLNDMLGALDLVIVVIIISAGLLALVVLYNLNNINISERQRELATLKVLGFYDPGGFGLCVPGEYPADRNRRAPGNRVGLCAADVYRADRGDRRL